MSLGFHIQCSRICSIMICTKYAIWLASRITFGDFRTTRWRLYFEINFFGGMSVKYSEFWAVWKYVIRLVRLYFIDTSGAMMQWFQAQLNGYFTNKKIVDWNNFQNWSGAQNSRTQHKYTLIQNIIYPKWFPTPKYIGMTDKQVGDQF